MSQSRTKRYEEKTKITKAIKKSKGDILCMLLLRYCMHQRCRLTGPRRTARAEVNIPLSSRLNKEAGKMKLCTTMHSSYQFSCKGSSGRGC